MGTMKKNKRDGMMAKPSPIQYVETKDRVGPYDFNIVGSKMISPTKLEFNTTIIENSVVIDYHNRWGKLSISAKTVMGKALNQNIA